MDPDGNAERRTRKTAVINALTDPLMHWGEAGAGRLRREIVTINAARAVAKKRIEKLIRDASNTDNDDARQRIRQEIEREEEGMPAGSTHPSSLPVM